MLESFHTWLANPRIRRAERMDADDVDPAHLARSLRFIRRINAGLGYTRGLIHHLERFSHAWKPGERIEVLDLATGSADIPRAILAWATRKKFDIHIVAVDRHPLTIRNAAEGASDPRLSLLQADVFDLPFDSGSFDYVITAMFLHHLDNAEIVRVMRTMDRLSRRGVIIADLLRHRRASIWINLFTAFASDMVRHDARASVRQALTRREVLDLRDRAGLDYACYVSHFGHRFILAGEKHPHPV